MDSGQRLVLIDTNIFVIDLRYKRDVHYKDNQSFLEYIKNNKNGFTTIFNLLEICGILSFNLNEKQLTHLWKYFQKRYAVTVIPEPDLNTRIPQIKQKDIFNLLKKRLSLGDALMLFIAENNLSFISTLITWDKEHFAGKYNGQIFTPDEFLKVM